jgi:glucose dehydrogenase
VVAAFVSAFSPIWLVKPTYTPAVAQDYKPENEPDSWVGFGRTQTGEQFAPYSQIDRSNIDKLEVAWTFHTGDVTGNGRENQNTPLQIGNILYPCTPTNQVFAVRGDTGNSGSSILASKPVIQRIGCAAAHWHTSILPAFPTMHQESTGSMSPRATCG